ncbi:MAG: ribonuclease HII [Deltaproteobacteria bacterium]|jgi:ribonuclease HII|nr:ribonuclease HII [Deltaproteobacteria bacterium]
MRPRAKDSTDSRTVKGPKVPDGFFLAKAQSLAAFDQKWGKEPVCGLDEAGRGPLAGPLVAAAVILDPKITWLGLDDSKKLTPQKREELSAFILERALAVGVAVKSARDVDRLNPLGASLLAMSEALEKLSLKPALALVDGNQKPLLSCPVVTVVKGDSKSLCIAAASIVAKVTRDRLMLEEHLKYPVYGFDQHKGYGVAAHLAALAKYGPSPIHRLTFRGVKPLDSESLFHDLKD